MTSKHYSTDRQERENLIKQIGTGTSIKKVRVDRGHSQGAEIHEITSTGIILIYNERTGKMITKLIARPGQIKRYWEEGKAPKNLVNLAYEHTTKRYNYF